MPRSDRRSCRLPEAPYPAVLTGSGRQRIQYVYVRAIATLACDADTGKAEVAISTGPEWKHQGVSWTLPEHAIRFAQGCGYAEIASVEKAE